MDFLVVVIVGRERDVIVIIVLYGCGVIGDRTCVGVADEIVIFGKILVGGEDLILGKILVGGEDLILGKILVGGEDLILGKILVGGEDLILGEILVVGEIVAQVAFEVLPIAEVDKIGVVKWV